MASKAIYSLDQETSLLAEDRFVLQRSSTLTYSTSSTFSLMGGMEVVSGTDADTDMDVGKLYKVDISAWATASRTYRLPSVANVGERVGVYIIGGNSSFELAIRTATASNDTINGVDRDSSDWSRLFITGEVVIFECVTQDTDWIVLNDGRIPCLASYNGTLSSVANFTSVVPDLSLLQEETNRGNIADLSSDWFISRRDNIYKFSIIVATQNSVLDDGEFVNCHITIDRGGGGSSFTVIQPYQHRGYSPETDKRPFAAMFSSVELLDGYLIRPRTYHNEGASQNLDINMSMEELI